MLAIGKCYSLTKVVVLTFIVLSSFVLSTFGWRHIEASESTKIIVAACILLFMYSLIIFEIVNRNLAALIGAAASVAAYDCLVEFVHMEDILKWEDVETLSLLFGMMVIVSILSETGLFDYLAAWAYIKSNGRFWLLIVTMSLVTCFTSAFIDNVSTMLIMAPTLIKLSKLEHVDPRYILMLMVIVSNIGGCSTPVGDPPNLIIISDPVVAKMNITFSVFVSYSVPCVLLTMTAILLYLKLVYGSKESFRTIAYKRRQRQLLSKDYYINDHEMTGTLMSSHTNSIIHDLKMDKRRLIEELKALYAFKDMIEFFDHELTEETGRLKRNLDEQTNLFERAIQDLERSESELSGKTGFRTTSASASAAAARRGSRLDDQQMLNLMRTHSIKNKTLLYQAIAVLVVSVILFFAASIPGWHLTLGWISLFAALVLLVMATASASDKEGSGGFDKAINSVEWSTLVFFFALFIVMEIMDKFGLIHFIGKHISHLIDTIPAGNTRTIGALTIVLWSSGLASACIDNVPFTSMMIKVVGEIIMGADLLADPSKQLLSKPLIFALVFGTSLGGNATLIGASSNLVAAGLSDSHGYPMTYMSFFKFTSPMAVMTLCVANLYLVLVFVVLGL